MRFTPDHLTYRNRHDGSIVYGGPPPRRRPGAWERVYVFTEQDVHARDQATRAQPAATSQPTKQPQSSRQAVTKSTNHA